MIEPGKVMFYSNSFESEIPSLIKDLDHYALRQVDGNEHVRTTNAAINGHSVLYDLSNTPVSSEIADMQGGSTVESHSDTPIHHEVVVERIRELTGITATDYFVQLINIGVGGRVIPHYDIPIDGYVTYKCNIVLAGRHKIYVNKDPLTAMPGDMYCFEASLYKHWLNSHPINIKIASYGFMIKYEDLGRSLDDPRVRMSRRILKYVKGT